MIRFFRPARLIRSGGATWLVDESWPVAARFGDDESMTVVAWPWPEGSVSEVDSVVVADGVGIVIGDGARVVWVREDGCTVAPVDGQVTLAAAEPNTAWFADMSYVDPGDPPTPPPPLPPGRVVAVRRDGSRAHVTTTAPVNRIGIRDGEVWVTLAEPPLARTFEYGCWRFDYPSSVFRVARDRLLADGLASAIPAIGDIPVTGYARSSSWTWLQDDPDTVLRDGVGTGGMIWWVGTPAAADNIDRRVIAVGHDPGTGRPRVRVDLGPGLVVDAQGFGNELWLTVARRRFLAVPRDRGVEVLTVSASGAVGTIHSPNSVDISQFARPLRRPADNQINDHIDEVRHQFDNLETYWRGSDGAMAPLSDGLTDSSVSVLGEWPDTSLVITMRHRHRPGLLLRRTLQLFDDVGSPIDRAYADMSLMEDLDTNHLAPADEAVDGVLDT